MSFPEVTVAVMCFLLKVRNTAKLRYSSPHHSEHKASDVYVRPSVCVCGQLSMESKLLLLLYFIYWSKVIILFHQSLTVCVYMCVWDFWVGVYIFVQLRSLPYKLSIIATEVQSCVVNITESPANWRQWEIQSYGHKISYAAVTFENRYHYYSS